MAHTRRAQILMEPEEYQQLEGIARRQGTSVAELVRTAVRERYLTSADDRQQALREICNLSIPLGDLDLNEEMAQAHADGLP